MLLRPPPHPLLLRHPPNTPFRRNPNFLLLKHRRRRKPVQSSLDELITNPSALYLLAPALSLISGAASFFLSSKLSLIIPRANRSDSVGDWVLFTNPTPFNRSVFLRCPSISFETDAEFLTEEKHRVNLIGNKFPISMNGNEEGSDLLYQRICIRMKDGGVVSLDWPESLDLREQHGLDTTLIAIPGNTQGSKGKDIKLFLMDALRHGYFPVVMNPRGCAGSPVTSPRLFTAADSDDVSTVVRFISTLRPWTTLVGASWGYGSNMLTNYLSEVGESTPLTSAVCIDNIFNLDESTRSASHKINLDREILNGLIDILEANKELFVGKEKGFDLEKGLEAVSLREFDEAVSRVSHGCETLDEFYVKSSIGDSVGNVKIPVLFIESGNGTVPSFTVPREDITSNPFTSLLLCSLPFGVNKNDQSSIFSCQQLAIEWLSAVELSLLKGRHPLSKELDISINPSKGLPFINSTTRDKTLVKNNTNNKSQKRHTNPSSNSSNSSLVFNGSVVNHRYLVGPTDGNASKEKKELIKEGESLNGDKKENEEQEEASVVDTEEESQVLQTASVVMNMLDVTMPGTLNDEKKKKVLTAMGKGETLMKALQEAVPEDVRGKLTAAATEIMGAQKLNLSLEALKGLTTKIRTQENNNVKGSIAHEETNGGISSAKVSNLANEESNGKGSNLAHEENNSNNNANKVSLGQESGEIKEATDQGETQTPSEEKVPQKDGNDSDVANLSSQDKGMQNTGESENVVSQKQTKPDQDDSQLQVSNVAHETNDLVESNDVNAPKDEVKRVDSPNAENNSVTPTRNETERQSNDTNKNVDVNTPNKNETERQNNEKVGEGNTSVDQNPQNAPPKTENSTQMDQNSQNAPPKTENSTPMDQNLQNAPPKTDQNVQNASRPPSMDVTQALDALSGFDDSTQMAVNSVFGVIENMIDELEKKKGNKNENGNGNGNENENGNGNGNEATTEKTENQDDGTKAEIEEKDQDSKDVSDKGKGNFGILPSKKNEIKMKETDKVQNLYKSMHNAMYFDELVSKKQLKEKEEKESTLDSTADLDLVLDPTEGKWKIIDQARNTDSETEDFSDLDSVIEPSYVILENDLSDDEINSLGDDTLEKVTCIIKDELFKALEMEVHRKLGVLDLETVEKDLFCDIQELASSISEKVVMNSELNLVLFQDELDKKIGIIEASFMIKTVSCVVQEATNLRKLLPLGVVIGTILASLRKYFQISESHDDVTTTEGRIEESILEKEGQIEERVLEKEGQIEESVLEKEGQNGKKEERESVMNRSECGGIMVGAVTAALGASAFLVQHEEEQQGEGSENRKTSNQKEEDDSQEKSNNIISSLAEKAMSVAGPVVPTKSGGEVDHERLVAVLAELGQKGGMLRFVGKLALLWGGIRGAMSLTDRLISFLRIGERPLLHRILGFVGMALVLWSPVVIPLLPTLVQCWTIRSSTVIVGYVCLAWFYVSVTILVMLWGRRIRGYDDPMQQYGLDLSLTHWVRDFAKGLIGGIMVVLSIHSISILLGCASLSSPHNLPLFKSNSITVLRTYGKELFFVMRGLVMATGVALVEELIFRSWLVEEIAVEFGYLRAFVLSGVLFSLIHRSVHSIPGYFLFSLVLSGMKQRSDGKLAAPIGMRAGIMTMSYTLHNFGLMKYAPNIPFWLVGSHLLHPFSGAVGLGFCLLLAVSLWPRKALESDGDQNDGVVEGEQVERSM
ncbi:hypothetical protein LUZ60_002848 [Juncus effusus]|nr:hypothetical protein LUZ60_002848 [Juncus effusus]